MGATPGASMPTVDSWDFLSFDKLAHFFVFAVLSFLLILGFSKQYTFLFIRYNAVIVAVVFSFVYGLSIELVQTFIPDRGAELADIVANSLGVFIGWLAFYLIYKL